MIGLSCGKRTPAITSEPLLACQSPLISHSSEATSVESCLSATEVARFGRDGINRRHLRTRTATLVEEMERILTYPARLTPIKCPSLALLDSLPSPSSFPFVKVWSSLWSLFQLPSSSLVLSFTFHLLYFAFRSPFLAGKSFLETVSFPISLVLICWFCVPTFEVSQIFLIDLRSKKVFVAPAVRNFSDPIDLRS